MQAVVLAMGLVIATNVDAGTIGRFGEPNSAGDTDISQNESGSQNVNKRSPFNPRICTHPVCNIRGSFAEYGQLEYY